jgi:hypothetical protein
MAARIMMAEAVHTIAAAAIGSPRVLGVVGDAAEEGVLQLVGESECAAARASSRKIGKNVEQSMVNLPGGPKRGGVMDLKLLSPTLQGIRGVLGSSNVGDTFDT